MKFDPLQYAVPGLIPEGASILIGPPKVGKSYLLGNLLLAVSGGGYALGKLPIERPRPTLYLALEDGDRRMQTRCRELLDGAPIPEQFNYLTRVSRGYVSLTIRAFLAKYPDTSLVAIDTLGKVMTDARPGETAYQRDYRVAGDLKAIADDHPGLSLVVVHHDRKAAAEDFVESVSGTNGLAGAMDTIAVLVRQRQSSEGVLKITGRDVVENEYALTVGDGRWTLDGSDLNAAAKSARQRVETHGLGDRSTQIIKHVREHPAGIGPTQLAKLLGGIEPKHAGEYLRRLAERGSIANPKRGTYTPVETTETVETAGQGDFPFPQEDRP
jgi:RecA-family ATPase